MSCRVCGCPEAETHFGAVTCRACAAFFRRYFHSKKSIVSCTCRHRLINSHPCRQCRMKKCLAVGMMESKVQEKREKHSRAPSMPSSCLPRCSMKIDHTTSSWVGIREERSFLFRKTLDETNYYDITCEKRADSRLLWKIAQEVFPETRELTRLDRDSLLRNFLPKWSVLATAIDAEINTKKYAKLKTVEDYNRMIVNFYTSSFPDGYQMTATEILTVFEPIVTFYGYQVIIPLKERKFDEKEYMALALLILFDSAYTNISVECAELCRNVRKVIMRELSGYQSDRGDMRFIDTIDSLNVIERGERKFYEELILCDMRRVHLHDDFRIMLNEHNT